MLLRLVKNPTKLPGTYRAYAIQLLARMSPISNEGYAWSCYFCQLYATYTEPRIKSAVAQLKIKCEEMEKVLAKADLDTRLQFDTCLQHIQEANEARLLGAGWLLTIELFLVAELSAVQRTVIFGYMNHFMQHNESRIRKALLTCFEMQRRPDNDSSLKSEVAKLKSHCLRRLQCDRQGCATTCPTAELSNFLEECYKKEGQVLGEQKPVSLASFETQKRRADLNKVEITI